MARTAKLNTEGRPGRAGPSSWVAVSLAVLLAHWAALAWLAAGWQEPHALRPLATPMFTRQIAPEAPQPPPVSQPKAAPAPMKRSPSAMESVAVASLPASPTPTASLPEEATADTSLAANTTDTIATTPGDSAAAATTSTAAATAYLDSWPADTRLSYRLGGDFRGELHGSARVQWQREAQRYQVRIEIDIGWLASVAMTSQGEVMPDGLFPRAYEEQLPGKRRNALLDESSITLGNGSKVARPEGVQDTASQFVELAHQFATGRKALETGGQLSVWLARPGGVDLWTYDVVEQLTLQLPLLGPVQAFHLKPRPIAKPRGNITAELWLAPSLQYLPVRIRIQMGEASFVDLLAERIEQR
ncbi:MAG: DUF3108 domain-containing protein [Burkholderiaceae bacterium]